MFFTKKQNEKYADVMIWAMESARKNGKFMSVEEIQTRCGKVSKGVIDMLAANNVLKDIPNTSQISLF